MYGSPLVHQILYLVSPTKWNSAMLLLFTVFLNLCQQRSNWLLGQYRLLASSFGKKLHWYDKDRTFYDSK